MPRECHELHTSKQSPLDSDHVLILNASLTWTDKGLRTQLFAKWSFVLVYPTSLIRHKSKYPIIFPYLRCNVSECETLIYYANYRLVLQSRFNGDTEVGALMFGSLYFILIKYHQCCQVSNAGTVCVCVCVRVRVRVRVCVCVWACARPLQLFSYTSRINFKHVLSY